MQSSSRRIDCYSTRRRFLFSVVWLYAKVHCQKQTQNTQDGKKQIRIAHVSRPLSYCESGAVTVQALTHYTTAFIISHSNTICNSFSVDKNRCERYNHIITAGESVCRAERKPKLRPFEPDLGHANEGTPPFARSPRGTVTSPAVFVILKSKAP